MMDSIEAPWVNECYDEYRNRYYQVRELEDWDLDDDEDDEEDDDGEE